MASLIALSRPTLRRLLPGIAFGLLVVGVYADPLFFRRNFSGRDLLGYVLPIEKSIHDAYARGRLPVWIPEISGGRPLAANPNVGALYPIRILQSILPYPLAMRTFPLIHWILAGWGMILLLRTLGTSAAGSWLGAVSYAFSAVSVSEVFFPNHQPGMVLLPWVVWAFARPETDRTKILLLSLLFALLLLAGDIFTSVIVLGSCVLWILFESPARERARDSIRLAFALLLAGLLAAPQIVATLLWIPETNRAVMGMKLKESLYYTLSPFRLAELVVPFPFGPTWRLSDLAILGWRVFGSKPMGFFASLYAGALVVVAVVVMWNRNTRGAHFARALLLVGLAASVGPSLFPKSWDELPSPVPLRYPEKFAVASTSRSPYWRALRWISSGKPSACPGGCTLSEPFSLFWPRRRPSFQTSWVTQPTSSSAARRTWTRPPVDSYPGRSRKAASSGWPPSSRSRCFDGPKRSRSESLFSS